MSDPNGNITASTGTELILSSKWTFKEGHREGFMAGPVTIFQGARLQSTIRETIQNSLDACQDATKPVRVSYSLAKQDLSRTPEIATLSEYFQAAKSEEESNLASEDAEASTQAMDFYTSALADVFPKRHVWLLGIHDFNTSGLGGNLREIPGQKPGQWLALVKGSGVDVKKDSSALGSFGQGGKAPFALSRLRTLFYLSKVESSTGEVSNRFQGKALLSSFWYENDEGARTLRTATGIYGDGSDQDAILGDDIPTWALEGRNQFGDGIGTSIYLAAPYGVEDASPDEFLESLKLVLLTNFYYALANNKLHVTLPDGSTISRENCKDIAVSLGAMNQEVNPQWDESTQDKVQSLRTMITPDFDGVSRSTEFEDFYWAIRVGENADGKRVGIARKTGMLITRKPPKFEKFPGVANFDLFVCVTGHKGSLVLRSLENPAHDAFEEDRISDPQKRKIAMTKYSRFVQEVRDIIKTYAKLEVTEEELTSDLNDLLSGDSSTDSEGDNRIEFPQKVRITSGIKPIRRTFRPVGTGGPGPKKGRKKRNSKRKSSSGSDFAKVVRNPENLVFIPKDTSGNFEVYFDYRENLPARITIFKSGDHGSEPTSFLHNSETKNFAQVTEADRIAANRDRFRISLRIPGYTGAVEATVEEEVVTENAN